MGKRLHLRVSHLVSPTRGGGSRLQTAKQPGMEPARLAAALTKAPDLSKAEVASPA